MLNGNSIWKMATRVLAGVIILIAGGFASLIWSNQQESRRTNTQQDSSILVLQKKIESVDKTVMRIEESLIKDRESQRLQDSILLDMAFKVNLMYDGR